TACFPELYLSEYRIIGVDQNYDYHISNGKDTLMLSLQYFLWEEFMDWEAWEEGRPADYKLTGDCTGYFSNENDSNYAKFSSYDRYRSTLQGLMESTGKIVQPLIYTEIADFGDPYYARQELHPFVFKNKVGIMNDSGVIVIPATYDNHLRGISHNRDWYHDE